MGYGITFRPFDQDRHRRLAAYAAQGRWDELAALLADGAAWRDPEAASWVERMEEAGLRSIVYFHRGLAADPSRFGPLAAQEIQALDHPDDEDLVQWTLVEASATAEPLECYGKVEELLGLFDNEWRAGYWPNGRPAARAPAGVAEALGGLDRAAHMLDSDAVRAAAALLEGLDVEAFPPPGVDAWPDAPPDGDLDETLREDLRRMITLYREAARQGWAMRVEVV